MIPKQVSLQLFMQMSQSNVMLFIEYCQNNTKSVPLLQMLKTKHETPYD